MQGSEEVCSNGPSAGKPKAHLLQAELVQKNEAIFEEWTAPVTPTEPLICPASPSEQKLNTKEPSTEAYAAHITAEVKELLLSSMNGTNVIELVWSPLRPNCSSKFIFLA